MHRPTGLFSQNLTQHFRRKGEHVWSLDAADEDCVVTEPNWFQATEMARTKISALYLRSRFELYYLGHGVVCFKRHFGSFHLSRFENFFGNGHGTSCKTRGQSNASSSLQPDQKMSLHIIFTSRPADSTALMIRSAKNLETVGKFNSDNTPPISL